MRMILLAGAAALTLAACGGAEQNAEPQTKPVEATGETEVELSVNPTRNAYFGDLHVHTGNSFDAFAFGVRRTPDDAYRFAKGERIPHDAGYDIQLGGPPLDFLAVTDHGEYLGIVPAMANADHPLNATETAQAAFGPNAAAARDTFLRIGRSFVLGQPIEEINDQAYMNKIWAETVAAADQHYAPGEFTTFAGYEFTAMRIVNVDLGAALNLHRNVIFRGDAPDQLFTTLDSPNPEELWDWMDEQRDKGFEVLSIPHNSNASNGEMFAAETYTGDPLDSAYAAQRILNEPLMEITQIKGTSETHPMLSPNDEWADFELYDYLIGAPFPSKPDTGGFARPALARGMAIEQDTGENPYKFGFIGSSDTHVAAATLDERTHFGKFPTDGASPAARSSVPPGGASSWNEGSTDPEAQPPLLVGAAYSASGLAGVWAEANTREAIFDAMRRKETFGTSGPRMKVRLFAGRYDADVINSADLASIAYTQGVPMGSDAKEGSPDFIAWAMRDADSAPLERLQIIKVWDEGGQPREAIFDVACATGAPDAATHRCPEQVASVDVATCDTSGAGAAELKTIWRDPAPEADTQAAYYIRALEVPTCRWSTWDATRNGTPPNPELATVLQERAWSSPIWVRN